MSAKFEKTIVCHRSFLENSKNSLNFTRISIKFGSRIFGNFNFLIFLIVLESSRKFKKILKNNEKYIKTWKSLDKKI